MCFCKTCFLIHRRRTMLLCSFRLAFLLENLKEWNGRATLEHGMTVYKKIKCRISVLPTNLLLGIHLK